MMYSQTPTAVRVFIVNEAKGLSEQYSWARCAAEIWDFLGAVDKG